MKKHGNVKGNFSFLPIAITFFLLITVIIGCTNEQLSDEFLGSIKDDINGKDFIIIENPGFELGKVGWGDEDDYSISNEEYAGSRAGKISSSGRIEQEVSVGQNTDFILKAWVKGNGTLSIGEASNNFDTDEYQEVSISFNSGNSSSVTIVGVSNDDDVRFDDFTLENLGSDAGLGDNLALGKVAEQSSTSFGGNPERAVDGNTSGVWGNGSVTHTSNTYRPWWQVRLGAEYTIGDIVIWNRTNCCSGRLSNFDVFVYNDAGEQVYKTTVEDIPSPSITIDAGGVVGSRVRVKLLGTNYLSLAEVQVFEEGVDNPGDMTPPNAVSDLNANAGNGSVSLSWKNPSDTDFDSVRITYNGESISTSSENRTITGLNNGTQYTFTVVAVDTSGNVSESRSVTATPTSGSTGGGGYPSDILSGLNQWKITFPIDEDGNDSFGRDDCDDRNRDAHEIIDITGEIPTPFNEYFYVDGDEVVFKAHVGGATTSGSNYTRSELRQRPGGGDNYWSMDDYQYLDVRVRATHLPVEKPEVSMVQIHGPDDEPLRVEYRTDSQGLHVVQNEDNTENYVLPYALGEQLRVIVTVDNGDITCRIINETRNLTWEETWEAEDSTGYFKVGCYTQSSMFIETCKPGEGYSNENYNAYGEVRAKDLTLQLTY